MKRSEAREKVFRILFQMEFHEDFNDLVPKMLAYEELKGNQGLYAQNTIEGIIKLRPTIDDLIAKNLKGWTLERLSKPVLALLRLGVYEVRFNDEIPVISAINEAVQLAYLYCDEKEANFINGILHNLSKQEIPPEADVHYE